MSPDEYARAVLGYSRLPTGAGQNHTALAEFLTTKDATDIRITIGLQLQTEEFVAVYPLPEVENSSHAAVEPKSMPLDANLDHDSSDDRRREVFSFRDPQEFFHFHIQKPQSRIIFLRGFMSANWINNIGGRYIVDPEYFCRHLDFSSPDDNSNNFSLPALSSSSWHLIELPIMTIGKRTASQGLMRLQVIENLRKEGASALKDHHHRISRLSSSDMEVGESMIREFYVFDENHFVIEQRVSVCMQASRDRQTFSCKSSLTQPH